MNKMTETPRLAWRRIENTIGILFYSERAAAILASYPKSGRTWFRFILSSYLAQAFEMKPAPDLHSMFKIMPNFDMDPIRGLPASVFGKDQSGLPLIPVSHLPYSRLRFRSHPTIFMVRDPRDVMVSSYFHATRQKHRFSGDIDGFLRDSKQGITSLTRYLNSWSTGLQHRKHIVVSYENLSRDPYGETAKVLGFLGMEVQPQVLDIAVETAMFCNMKKLELTAGLPGHDYDRNDDESLRMRRGKVGGFADYLTTEQIRLIETICNRELTTAAKRFLEVLPDP